MLLHQWLLVNLLKTSTSLPFSVKTQKWNVAVRKLSTVVGSLVIKIRFSLSTMLVLVVFQMLFLNSYPTVVAVVMR